MNDVADNFEAEINKVEFKETTTDGEQNFDDKSNANTAELKTAVIKSL
ncbi:hypothetical protein IDZ49_10515 [Francisella tularensis]|nr:hypothetical protein [Francisella tularensis]